MKKRQVNRGGTIADTPLSEETNFAAWEANPQAQTVRVDLQNGEFFIFPYSHFAFAHFSRDEQRETLCISFTAHEVRVSGRQLREVGVALQKFTVEWIREIPARYTTLAEKGRAVVERIEVTEIAEEEAPPE